VTLRYEVGAKEPLTWMLPSVVKTPDCGPPLKKFKLESKDSSLGSQPLDSIVTFDAETSSLTVATDDASLVGHKIELVFAVVHNTGAKSEKLGVTVELHDEESLAAVENELISEPETASEASNEAASSGEGLQSATSDADDTEDETAQATAEFDIIAWLESASPANKLDEKFKTDTLLSIQLKELMRTFCVPIANTFNSDGSFSFTMSDKITLLDPALATPMNK